MIEDDDGLNVPAVPCGLTRGMVLPKDHDCLGKVWVEVQSEEEAMTGPV